jgi:ABC-type transport system involved in multi-copper enzyme maturation permease subunit
MNSLWWKEWRESRRYLAIFIAWMTLAVCYAIGHQLGPHVRTPMGHFSGLALIYTFFAAIVLAMRTSHGERTDGTIAFSAALPVSLRGMATVRIVSAALTLAVPIVIAAGILALALAGGLVEQGEPRFPGYLTPLEHLGSVTAIAILGGVELLLVLSLLGCYLRSQAQIGVVGAVMAFGSLITSGVFSSLNQYRWARVIYGALLPQSLVMPWGSGYERGGFYHTSTRTDHGLWQYYTDHEVAQYRWSVMSLSLLVLALLGRLFVTRYGALRGSSTRAKPRRFRIAFPPILSRIPIRLPGRLLAMIWLELRQAMPLATCGFLLAVLMAIAIALLGVRSDFSSGPSLLTALPDSMVIVGMLWPVVVGSGLYSADLGSGLGAFWRSRPISPDLWFWTKFVVGLAAVVGWLDGVTMLVSWKAPRAENPTLLSWAYVGCFPIIHALMYALAVLGTCWFRRAVIGGILAILGYSVLNVAITAFPMTSRLEPIDVFQNLNVAERSGQVDFTQHGYPLVYGVLVVSTVLLALLSSRLARPLQPASRLFVPHTE